MADMGGVWGAAYRGAGRLLGLLAPLLLRRRMTRGREDPARWREKLGQASLPRPDGRLVWLHAVGLGEVLALRAIITRLAAVDSSLNFLVTCSSRNAADVFVRNLPPRCQHQFAPLDCPQFVTKFLDHWQPDLIIWSEQDIWPGVILAARARAVPQVLINARMDARSFTRRHALRALYAPALRALQMIDAQDAATAQHLQALGAGDVTVSGSLKPAGPPLAVDAGELSCVTQQIQGRTVWLAASSHPNDEAEALAAQAAWGRGCHLLIIAPRDITRADAIAVQAQAQGLNFMRRSQGTPTADTDVWIADSYGEMGLWYSLAEFALIGGGFGTTGGHNPWEAVQLDAAVLHGPDVANFRADYAALDGAGAARELAPGELVKSAPTRQACADQVQRARACAQTASAAIDALAARLMHQIGGR